MSGVTSYSSKEKIMDANTMTFEEILFHGRYHIIGGVLFLVFFGAFIREAVRELVSVW